MEQTLGALTVGPRGGCLLGEQGRTLAVAAGPVAGTVRGHTSAAVAVRDRTVHRRDIIKRASGRGQAIVEHHLLPLAPPSPARGLEGLGSTQQPPADASLEALDAYGRSAGVRCLRGDALAQQGASAFGARPPASQHPLSLAAVGRIMQ